MSEARELIADTVERLFADGVDHERIVAAEEGRWPADLWASCEAAGLTRPHLAEERDGAGGDWLDVFEVARAAGRHAVPLPLVETILAGWLLDAGGLEVPAGPLTVGEERDGVVARVPWGRECAGVVVLAPATSGAEVRYYSGAELDWQRGENLAREPRDDARLPGAPSRSGSGPVSADAVRSYGALLRSAQMAGALEGLLEQSIRYAGERVQFGRAIGQFQVIQQEIARLAGQVALAQTAAEVGFRSAAEASPPGAATRDPRFEIAAAKIVAGNAAELGPRIAHQVHGAIGFTYEHSLHFSSRRLWAWRAEYGAAEEWAAWLGDRVVEAGAEGLWPLVTSR